MNLSTLLQRLRGTPDYRALLEQLGRTSRTRLNLNMLGAARAYLLTTLQQDLSRAILLITPKPDHALQWDRLMSSLAAKPESIYDFAEPDPLPSRRAGRSV